LGRIIVPEPHGRTPLKIGIHQEVPKQEKPEMTDDKSKTAKPYHSKGLKYYGQDLEEVATTHDDDNWQFVRINDQDYPRKCVRIEGDGVLVSIACVESEGGDKPGEVGVEYIHAKLKGCKFFYVTDSDGHPIEWKIKR
jgi:hypothetical protein